MNPIILRPSAVDRWLNCPASVFHNDENPTKYSKAGNDKHLQAHDILTNKKPIEKDLKKQSDVEFYCNYIRMHEVFAKKIDIEKTLEYQVTDQIILRGTPDCVIYFDDVIEIVDFKSGYQDVDPECYQLILYAALACVNMSNSLTVQDVKVILTVVQNKIIKQKILNKVFDKLDKVLYWNPEKDNYKTGSWCQFCSFKPKCRTYLNGINPILNLLPDPKTLTDAVLASYYDMRSFVKNYFESVRKELLSRIEQGNAPTHRIVEKKRYKYKFDGLELIKKINLEVDFKKRNRYLFENDKLRSPEDLIRAGILLDDKEFVELVKENIKVEIIKTIKPVDEVETNLLPPLNDSTEGV